MKQIEVTVRLKEDLESAKNKLLNIGYTLIRECDIHDIYMSSRINELNKDNITDILSKSVLLRSIKKDDKEIMKITYKDKEYDDNGNVISENKININCEDLHIAYKLFTKLDFEKLVEVKYHLLVYGKDGIEYAFQDVENLGILIEYENLNDFDGKSTHEINIEKRKMYNNILNDGLILTDELDVKKAKELIMKERFN